MTKVNTPGDLQKAFDTIDHKILLQKLKCIGLSDSAIDWIKSYLTNPTTFLEIKGFQSSEKDFKCGVPQGSILGPLLFLIYVNDMCQAVNCDLSLYADDSYLTVTHRELEVIEDSLNANLSVLCDWFVDNKLSIHLGKTESILFGTKHLLSKANNLDIKYCNEVIEQKETVRYLGLTLDSMLNGKSMVESILAKINNKLKFLYRKQRFLNKDLRRLLCNSLIQPHYDFACCSWYPLLTKNLKDRLQVSQNKCIRFCLNLSNRASIDNSKFKEINWLPVEKRYEQCVCTLIYKYFHNNVPGYINDIFTVNKTRYNTRNSNMLKRPLCKTSNGMKAISYLGPKLWDNMPIYLKQKESISCFKHGFKRFILQNELIIL